MKLISKMMIIGSVLLCMMACTNQKNAEENFSFILAADWRYTAMEKYDSPMYFRGALEAIEKVGKGAFMISPGDVEPVDISHEMISAILGDDYPWYPIMGNHELEIPSTIDYLREINNGGTLLPYVVNKGPAGCEETTFSFDYGNSHFVILNQYYDGSSDVGTDGDIVDALYDWLKNDLENTNKKHVFVAGHEPIVSIPDMNNGRHRHIGDSLDQYPRNAFRFHQLLLNHNITAYLHGHTHSTSYSNINGLWQIDCGHARGTESEYPEKIFSEIFVCNLIPLSIEYRFRSHCLFFPCQQRYLFLSANETGYAPIQHFMQQSLKLIENSGRTRYQTKFKITYRYRYSGHSRITVDIYSIY